MVPAGGPEAQLVDASKPRLMIKSILLENFKSYGNQKLIGPFHKSFSSIVGPNGSGKSNTIDALLFVFGKRAKKMRLNKVSELIHSSSSLPSPPSAKVSVTFQDIIDTGSGPEDYEVIEGSLLTVTREAYRNNTSKYFLDLHNGEQDNLDDDDGLEDEEEGQEQKEAAEGKVKGKARGKGKGKKRKREPNPNGKSSNFTEVTTLLRKRGVDLEHNRFLILQGEVEQISLMKPKALTAHEDGLLEYLEDIIGSNRLVEPIEEAEGIVEKLTEQRQEKLNRLRVAERERDNLDGPRREAEVWVTAEAERLELQALLAQSEAKRSHASVAGLEAEHKKLQGHMEEHRKRMEGFEVQVKKVEHDHNTHLVDYNKIKAQMEKAALDFKELERQDVKYTEDIAFHEQKIQNLLQSAEKDKVLAKKLLDDAEDLRNFAPDREKELAKMESNKAKVEQEVEVIMQGLKGKAEKLRPLKEAKEKELVPLQQRLTEVQKVVSVAQTEAQFLREKTEQVAQQIEDMKREHGECAQRLSVRERESKDAAELKAERLKLTTEARERSKTVAKQMEEVSREVSAARIKAEEARSSFEEEHYRGRLIKAVNAASKAGQLKGVYGRLGDLGTIPKKYDIAVSTACGMLDAIVVDTTEDAQAVIGFIRQQDLGRATCISLDKIRGREAEMNQAVQTPENVPRLVDLIKATDPKFNVAFFFALQHTLVANDMDQASRVAFQGRKRWRVVTLQGQLIDTSGTMSGGGHQVAKGGMRAAICPFTPEQVKELVHTYEQANARLVAIRHERAALDEAVMLTEKEIADFDLREQKANMDIASLTKQVDAYAERLKSLKVPTLNSQEKTKLKELEKLITGREGELNKIQQHHHEVEEEVRELHTQIMDIGGDTLRVAKAKLEEATKQCEEMRRGIKKAVLDAEIMVKNSHKAEASSEKALQDKVAAEKALVVLKDEHANLDDKAETVLNSHNQLKDNLAEKDQILTKLRQQRDEIIKQASDMKNSEVDLVNEIEEKTRVLKEIYGRIAAWGAKLQEARAEYKELPLAILKDLRLAAHDGHDGPSDAQTEMARAAIATELPEDTLAEVVRADVEARILTLEANVKNLKPNLSSIEDFRKADAEHKTRLSDYEEVNGQREEARAKLDGLKQKRLEEFMDGFSIISMKLKEMYQMITLGGDAELELVDTLDPFSEGISFSVRPPKKSWKQITNLSGGEKTLASLSLVFALHHYRPTPLYFMDEIDAALDFRNVSIIANYIKERTKNAQFIVISLRNHMFELADLLVGIYKTQDISKSVAINPTAFEVQKLPGQTPGRTPLNSKVAITGPSEIDAVSAKRALPPVPIEAAPAAKRQKGGA